MITSEEKKRMLHWFVNEFSLRGMSALVARKLSMPSLLHRIHFVHSVSGKKFGVYIFIGDVKWDTDEEVESGDYEQTATLYIDGNECKAPKQFFEAALKESDEEIYIHLDYEGNENCKNLAEVLEPIISLQELLDEIENDLFKRKEAYKKIVHLIDEALDERDFEKVKFLSERKQTLLNEDPLI